MKGPGIILTCSSEKHGWRKFDDGRFEPLCRVLAVERKTKALVKKAMTTSRSPGSSVSPSGKKRNPK